MAMSNDNDWVEDVKRWCDANPRVPLEGDPPGAENTDFALGYEAAQPALQARHWLLPDGSDGSTC
jgi:hypothetical protein